MLPRTHTVYDRTPLRGYPRLSKLLTINNMSIGLQDCYFRCVSARQELTMQTLITAITVTAGMTFSLAIALLVEEWIFGKVFGLFFSRQPMQITNGQER